MIFLYEIKIYENKRIDLNLQICLGINKYVSRCIFAKLGFNLKNKQKNLSKKIFNQMDSRIIQCIEYIFFFKIESSIKNLIFNQLQNVKTQMNLKSLRHFLRLPVRGQRTKNNAQTQKHKRPNWRRTPIAKKKNKNE